MSLLFSGVLASPNREQEQLLFPLVDLLSRRRMINGSTKLVLELSWNGRRVDLAALGTSGRSSAYELKVGSFNRVLEQAMYNRLAFDRSWIVVAENPLPSSMEHALENGIGVISIGSHARVLAPATLQTVSPPVRTRLRNAFEKVVEQPDV